MNYKLLCKACGCYAWVGGTMECIETGAVDLEDMKKWEWNFKNEQGQTDLYEGPCPHDEYDITDSEYDDYDLQAEYMA